MSAKLGEVQFRDLWRTQERLEAKLGAITKALTSLPGWPGGIEDAGTAAARGDANRRGTVVPDLLRDIGLSRAENVATAAGRGPKAAAGG